VPADRESGPARAVRRVERHGSQRFAILEVQRLARDFARECAGCRDDDERALVRRRRPPADVLQQQRRGEEDQRRHVEIRGYFAVLSDAGGKSKYASTSSSSSSSE